MGILVSRVMLGIQDRQEQSHHQTLAFWWVLERTLQATVRLRHWGNLILPSGSSFQTTNCLVGCWGYFALTSQIQEFPATSSDSRVQIVQASSYVLRGALNRHLSLAVPSLLLFRSKSSRHFCLRLRVPWISLRLLAGCNQSSLRVHAWESQTFCLANWCYSWLFLWAWGSSHWEYVILLKFAHWMLQQARTTFERGSHVLVANFSTACLSMFLWMRCPPARLRRVDHSLDYHAFPSTPLANWVSWDLELDLSQLGFLSILLHLVV